MEKICKKLTVLPHSGHWALPSPCIHCRQLGMWHRQGIWEQAAPSAWMWSSLEHSAELCRFTALLQPSCWLGLTVWARELFAKSFSKWLLHSLWNGFQAETTLVFLVEFCYASHTALICFQTFAHTWFKLGMGSGIIANRGKIMFPLWQWLTYNINHSNKTAQITTTWIT